MRTRLLSAGVVAMLAGAALAQPVAFTQWKFNANPTGQIVNNPAPSTGQGTAIPLGMTNNYTFSTSPVRTGSTTACDITGAGASGDTASSPNNCWRVRGSYDGTLANAGVGWALAAQYTQGAEFDVSTVNYANVVFTFDWFTTNQGVHNMQVQYSTNAGAAWTNIGPVLASATNGWINNVTVDLSAITAVNDNPNFRIRLVSVYDPSYTGAGSPCYTGASGGPYNNASGNWRFDRVTFTGTPVRSIGPSISTASVTPPAVCASGGPLTFSVSAVGGANPLSTGLAVTADLSPLGLSAAQALFDDGTNGDQFAGDGIFTYAATVPGGGPLGPVGIPIVVSDAQSRTASTNVAAIVGDCSGTSAARVVISQTFGGGGNLGALPADDAFVDADYVELFNRSNQAVSLNGWSVQYASQGSAGGFDNTGDRVLLSGIVQPGQHVLVRMSDPVPGFAALPTPDFAQLPGFGGMGNSGGRVALVRSTSLLGTNFASPDIEDLVGYGAGAITFEGVAPTATPNPSSNRAVVRKAGGNQDTNQNFNDFTTDLPFPSNRASGGFLAGYPSLSSVSACAGSDITLFTRVSPGSGSTSIGVSADISQITGSAGTVTLFDDGPAGGHGDAVPNDNVFTGIYSIPTGVAQGFRTIPFLVTDAQGHTDTSSLELAVATCVPSAAPVVISQVYGGGGNDASGYNGDFAEIFNRSQNDVNLTGWSFQSARITDQGFDSRIAFLSGIIHPGEYRLILTNLRSATGAALPAEDFLPSPLFGMESSFGRVALVSSTNLLHTDYNRFDVVDLVGYGSASQSFEGVSPTGTLSDVLVAVRKDGGCQDTNQNGVDFDIVLALNLPHNSASPVHICSAAPTCDPDLNQDGNVDQDDVAYLINVVAGGDNPSNIDPDFNHDGNVDQDDVAALINTVAGGPCP